MEFYDAVLVVSFGGPEGPDEVMPFLEHVTRGKNIPVERLEDVAEHYLRRGGISPINDQVRELMSALRERLGDELPLYWGNRNSAPWLADAVARIAADGHHRVLALLTSAFPSYSGCRQYRENLSDALEAAGVRLEVDVVPAYGETRGFVDANVMAVTEAARGWEAWRLVFVTHSIPEAMAETSGPAKDAYVAAHRRAASAVAEAVGQDAWDLVYCSRSGPPRQPWLTPDVNDHLRVLAEQGEQRVVLAPIGFVSDHMEVLNDLDDEAVATGAGLDMAVRRAATAGTRPVFVDELAALVRDCDRAALAGQDPWLIGRIGAPAGQWCAPSCCVNPRDPGRAAVAERQR